MELEQTQRWQMCSREGIDRHAFRDGIEGQSCTTYKHQHQLYLVCVGQQAVEDPGLARSDVGAVGGSFSLAGLPQAGVQHHILGGSGLQVVGLRKALAGQLVLVVQQTLQMQRNSIVSRYESSLRSVAVVPDCLKE